ncbi:MAG: helix-turn-helix domain-containing protein [Chloroflexi bacterium]|nr:helix-turn-helix domain-containing protein [Chloroflexota bacterium]
MESALTLGERLVAARERKGVDLYRAERDTKIRMRYLTALERGDDRDLPGAVYTKGFLRNYATYLGLDPDEILRQWRKEHGEFVQSTVVVAPPRPLVQQPRALTFSPSVVVAALMTLGVIAFGVYLSLQLLRFARPPLLTVTHPPIATITESESATEYLLQGRSSPGATISVSTPGRDQPYRATTLADGSWSVSVELRRGENLFDITATDPETGKQAEEPRQVVITVPFLVIQAPTLTVAQPVDGTSFENGAIPVEGTATNAATVRIETTFLGPVDGVSVTPAPAVSPGASPGASPTAGPGPPPITLTPDAEGAFATPLELTTGRWSITFTATSPQGKTAALTRTVTIEYRGVNLVVDIAGGDAWLKVWIDGVLDESIGASGRVFRSGRTLTFTGDDSIEVRTGSSGATRFTLNGVSLGALGSRGVPETWLFAPPDPPLKTSRR